MYDVTYGVITSLVPINKKKKFDSCYDEIMMKFMMKPMI